MSQRRLEKLINDRYCGAEGLRRTLTVAEAEARFAVRIGGPTAPSVPFGYLDREWKRFVAKMKPGDEIWEFETVRPRGDVIAGVKLMRDGAVIDAIVAQEKRVGTQTLTEPDVGADSQ